MNYSKGITWFDDCRIPFVDGDTPNTRIVKETHKKKFDNVIDPFNYKQDYIADTKGRFPANLLCSDDMLNDGSISKSGFNPNAKVKQYRGGNFGGGKTNDNGIDYGDKGSNSRYYDIDKWFDKMINEL